METAFEAVKDIVEGIPDRSSRWNVNVERTYHEAGRKKTGQDRTADRGCPKAGQGAVMHP